MTKPKTKGRRPSTQTLYWNGQWEWHLNELVIKMMEELLAMPYVNRKVTHHLGNQGYWINKKKVYRLMKSRQLLRGDQINMSLKTTNRVKGRMVVPEEPFVYYEMDIKQLYIYGLDRVAFLLTIIDVYTRTVVGWYLAFHISHQCVLEMWTEILKADIVKLHLVNGPIVHVRSDNGSVFIANKVVDFFSKSDLTQEFTHVACPEENGHIESFHSILEDALCHIDFESLEELHDFLESFYAFYNNDRIHESLCGLSPSLFYHLWEKDLIEEQIRKGRKVFFLKVKRYLIKDIIAVQKPELCKCQGLKSLPVRVPRNILAPNSSARNQADNRTIDHPRLQVPNLKI